jgi:hypothetical protein
MAHDPICEPTCEPNIAVSLPAKPPVTGGGSGGGGSSTGASCADPTFVNVCNFPAPVVVGIETGITSTDLCAPDGGPILVGETKSVTGGASVFRLIHVSPAGVITDPYTGATAFCSSASGVEIHRENTFEQGCANGVPYVRIISRLYQTTTGAVLTTDAPRYRNSAGVETSTEPSGFTLGECKGLSFSTTVEEGCIAGLPVNRITYWFYDSTGAFSSSIPTYYNSAGTTVSGAGFVLGNCAQAVSTANIIATCANVSPEVTTARQYTETIRALIDQIVKTAGCNDDRRDNVLSLLLAKPAEAANPDITRTITRVQATSSGSVVTGSWSQTFINVGTTDATVLGAPLKPGETVSFTGYYDEQVRRMIRLPAIPYVASATAILNITGQL